MGEASQAARSMMAWWARAAAVGLLIGAGVWIGARLIADRRYHVELASVRKQLAIGRFAESLPWLERQAKSGSQAAEVLYWLGVCRHAAGDPAGALGAWERVPSGSAFATRANLARAQTLIGDFGRYAAAEPLLESVMRDPGPDGQVARYALFQLAFYQGRHDTMRRLIEDGWRRSAKQADELRDSWRIDEAAVSLDEVRNEIERAAKRAPDDDQVWLALANIAILTGRDAEARRRLDDCLAKRPDDPAVWRARLRWAREFNHVAEVRRALPHLEAEALSATERLDLRAWLAARDGRRDEERHALEELVRITPGHTRALERLAVLAGESQDTEAAARYRKQKADSDANGERYMRLLEDGGPLVRAEQFAELGRLSEALGRWFEAKGWWTLAVVGDRGQASYREALTKLERRPEPPKPEGATLATVMMGPAAGAATASKHGDGASAGEPDFGPTPAFRDRAEESGLRFTFQNGRSLLRQLPETSSGGVGVIDFDGDGWLDLYLVQGGAFPPDPASPFSDRLFHNRGDGTFEDRTEAAGLSKFPGGYGHGVTVGDYDNDGQADLLITRWRSYALYRNRGDGTFENATETAGLAGDRDWPTSAAFADLDNDGDLDLYVCHYAVWDENNPTLCPRDPAAAAHAEDGSRHDYCNPNPFPARPDHLFRNDGGRFVDASDAAGITAADVNGRGFGVVAADYDGDGRVDLFVANDTTANYLFHNLGELKFEEIGLSAGVGANAGGGYQAGMGVACGDLDGDGRPDLAVTNFYGESTTFYQNLGPNLFADRTAAIGLAAPSRFLLGFGIVIIDFNNDGYLDLATANGHVNDSRPKFPYPMPALLMAGSAGGRMEDVSRQAGPPFEVTRIGRALAGGDFDNDGRVDLVIVSQDGPVGLLHNETAAEGYVTFRLEGTKSPRDGVGAVVTLRAGGRDRVLQRVGGGSFQSASAGRLHFGLGQSKTIDHVEVQWPSGHRDRFEHLSPGTGYRLREADPTPQPLPGFQQGKS